MAKQHEALSGDGMQLTAKKIEAFAIVEESIERAWWRWTTHAGPKTFLVKTTRWSSEVVGPLKSIS